MRGLWAFLASGAKTSSPCPRRRPGPFAPIGGSDRHRLHHRAFAGGTERGRRRAPALLLLLGLLLAASSARAGEPVDVALVLAVDVSLSVNDERYQLQRDGIAAAFENPDLAKAIAAGPNHAVAVAVLQFSDPDRQFAVIEWTRIASAADAQLLATQIRRTGRSSDGLTGMADALLGAQQLLDSVPFPATRRVVDLSGDGMNNVGTQITAARDQLIADGITINGLPILTEEPWLETYFTEYVIGGPDAFVITAESLNSFADAMKRKLVQEVAVS
jgi:Protein of unknown function (DUF1194)